MIELRPAKADELPDILNLLGHYDVGREYFSPWYLRDPDYQIDHSWIVRDRSALLAHLRVFPRKLRLAGGAEISVAGVGNVITHPDHRGRGHAAHLLEEVLVDASRKGYAYSLLWTHLPQVYEPHGYGQSSQLVLELEPAAQSARASVRQQRYQLAPFRQSDLAEVSALYGQANQSRAGTTVRSGSYWQALLARTTHDTMWLLARAEDGSLAGHIRAVAGPQGELVVEELSFLPTELDAATALIDAAATATSSPIRIIAPPSYVEIFGDRVRTKRHEPGLMGKPLNLESLAQALTSLSLGPPAHSQPDGYRVRLVGQKHLDEHLLIGPTGATVVRTDPSTPATLLDAAQLTTLLFTRDPTAAEPAIGTSSGRADVLPPIYFPLDDPVLWPADGF